MDLKERKVSWEIKAPIPVSPLKTLWAFPTREVGEIEPAVPAGLLDRQKGNDGLRRL